MIGPKLDWKVTEGLKDLWLTEEREMNLLRYAILLHTNGDGSSLLDPRQYPLKRLRGTYERLYRLKRGGNNSPFPSLKELCFFAANAKGPYVFARIILDEGEFAQEVLSLLTGEYINYKRRGNR